VRRRTKGLVAVGGALCLVPGVAGRSTTLLQVRRRSRRWVRGIRARLQGEARCAKYRFRDGEPSADVGDLVLADRIRSTIGPLTQQLDLPHIHVMVNDHVAMLHGEVDTAPSAVQIEQAVHDVSGVRGVESYLHVGLLASDTRPSTGRAQTPQHSNVLRALVDVAAHTGAGTAPQTLVKAVLSTLLEQIPPDERRHVLSHLPDDVRRLTDPPRRRGTQLGRIRRVDDFFEAIALVDPDLSIDAAEQATVAVLAALVRVVPEEVADVEAVLPRELRELWQRAVATPDAGSFTKPTLELLEQM
jgi:uncharacterized protein (DUF2267 family)